MARELIRSCSREWEFEAFKKPIKDFFFCLLCKSYQTEGGEINMKTWQFTVRRERGRDFILSDIVEIKIKHLEIAAWFIISWSLLVPKNQNYFQFIFSDIWVEFLCVQGVRNNKMFFSMNIFDVIWWNFDEHLTNGLEHLVEFI